MFALLGLCFSLARSLYVDVCAEGDWDVGSVAVGAVEEVQWRFFVGGVVEDVR